MPASRLALVLLFSAAVASGCGRTAPFGRILDDGDDEDVLDAGRAYRPAVPPPCLSHAPVTGAPGSYVPVSVVAADFDRDQRPDLAVADVSFSGGGMLKMYYGESDAGFRYWGSDTVNVDPVVILEGHFNADGWPDLFSANSGGHDVNVKLNPGDGGIPLNVAVQTLLGPTVTPRHACLGDFTGDGRLDAVVTSGDDKVRLLPGDGLGGFSAKLFSVSGRAGAVAANDLNADGKVDLAIADEQGDGLTVWLGDGAGAFGGTRFLTASMAPRALVSADFNGDGIADLAAATAARDLTVLTGRGNATFAPPRHYDSGGPGIDARTLAAVDFQGDGRAELVTVDELNDSVSILSADSEGVFQLRVTFPMAGWRPIAVDAADFNRDGVQDLVVVSQKNPNAALLLSGKCE